MNQAKHVIHKRYPLNRHLPVIENGRLCGLISIGDVVRHRMMEIEYENLKMKQAMVG